MLIDQAVLSSDDGMLRSVSCVVWATGTKGKWMTVAVAVTVTLNVVGKLISQLGRPYQPPEHIY